MQNGCNLYISEPIKVLCNGTLNIFISYPCLHAVLVHSLLRLLLLLLLLPLSVCIFYCFVIFTRCDGLVLCQSHPIKHKMPPTHHHHPPKTILMVMLMLADESYSLPKSAHVHAHSLSGLVLWLMGKWGLKCST